MVAFDTNAGTMVEAVKIGVVEAKTPNEVNSISVEREREPGRGGRAV